MSAVLPESAGATMPKVTSADVPPRPVVAGALDAPAAVLRLNASRERLRHALMDIANPPPKPSLLDDVGLGDVQHKVLGILRGLPGFDIVFDSVQGWWREHPLRTAGLVARQASAEVVGPMARRNPFGVILAAAAVGGLLVLSRPWRWLLRPALFVGLVPQIASRVLRRMPIESWVHVLSTVSKRRAPAGTKAPRAERPSTAPREPG